MVTTNTNCTKCGGVGPFYTRPTGGVRQPCKDCCRKQNKEYRNRPDSLERKRVNYRKQYAKAEVRERILERSKVYRRRHYLKTKFGLTPEEIDVMATARNGRCDICGRKPSKLNLDHSHATGKVRGLLCSHCNLLLGQAKDKIATLESAIGYLLFHGDGNA